MHDGAMIIYNDKIYSAGAILPISENQQLPKELGLRHRAGIGISERSNAVTLIVSEETGIVSVAQNGILEQQISSERLEEILEQAFK